MCYFIVLFWVLNRVDRDEAQAKMILLKERADKDLQQHNAEMKELVRILDHDRKLKEFMGIKVRIWLAISCCSTFASELLPLW